MNMAIMYWPYSVVNCMSNFMQFLDDLNSIYKPFVRVVSLKSLKMSNRWAESDWNQETFGHCLH